MSDQDHRVEFAPGTRVGSFVLGPVLGRGGMAVVYLAEDVLLKRQVAIKFPCLCDLPNVNAAVAEHAQQRFLREAQFAARIVHPHVVQIFQVGVHRDCPYLVMEYVPGETLEHLQLRTPALPIARSCHLLGQVCQALSHVWEQHRIIHRDLKPGNVMVLAGDHVKLLDFGIAKDAAAPTHTLTPTGETVGTPIFMSPEQHRGEPDLDLRSDMYALGSILCLLLTGQPPFGENDAPALFAAKLQGLDFRLEERAPLAPWALVQLVERLLEVDRDRRPGTYAEIEAVLNACAGLGSGAVNAAAAAPEQPEPRRWASAPTEAATGAALPSAPRPPSDWRTKRQATVPAPAPEVEALDFAPDRAFLPHVRAVLEAVCVNPVLGDYEALRLIGCGGMGAVFAGRHLPTGEPVALKVLIANEAESSGRRLARFRREAGAVGRLDHPAIVPVREIVESGSLHFLVMDLVLGFRGHPTNLRDYARLLSPEAGLLDQEDVQQIVGSLLDAIEHAHSRGVIHCDLKPENVLLQEQGAVQDGYWFARLKLTDFGLARIVGEDLVLASVSQSLDAYGPGAEMPEDANALIGTYDYMSPEQRRGEPATARSDVFAVGMILLRLLTGAREIGFRQGPSQLRSGLDPQWDDLILRALEEDPADRFPSARAMAAELAAIRL